MTAASPAPSMMTDVAQTAMANDYWGFAAVALVAVYCLVSGYLTFAYIIDGPMQGLSQRLKARAKLCLDRTGFVGALITRHTLLVTMNVIVLNLSLSLMSALRGMGTQSASSEILTTSLQVACVVCVALILLIAVVTFALCSEIVRLAEHSS